MLAVAGSSVFLASVLVAGFGYGYKATFLLLGVPLVSALLARRQRIVVSSSLCIVVLIAITSVVVWNTVLATLAGAPIVHATNLEDFTVIPATGGSGVTEGDWSMLTGPTIQVGPYSNPDVLPAGVDFTRSEEHTSEL